MVIEAVKSAYWTVIRPKERAAERLRAIAIHGSAPSKSDREAGGERQPEQGADRAQDEAAVGLVAFGTEDEEDRQRDPVAVLPHPGDAVDRDAEPERDAVADRVAGDRRGERPVVAQPRLGPRPVPAALVVGVAVVDEPDASRPGRLDQARRRCRRGGPEAPRGRAGRGPGRSSARPRRRSRRRRAAGCRRSSSPTRPPAGPSPAPPPGRTGCSARRAPPRSRPAAPPPPARGPAARRARPSR